MSDSILIALITVLGGGGVWQYIRMSEANRILAQQSVETISAKDRQIEELRSENERLWRKNERLNRRNDDLMEHLTRPVQAEAESQGSSTSSG